MMLKERVVNNWGTLPVFFFLEGVGKITKTFSQDSQSSG
jgi:hypothetical protein